MAFATSRTCWIWSIWFALIYGFHYLIGNQKTLEPHNYWGCGCFSPTITPEEPFYNRDRRVIEGYVFVLNRQYIEKNIYNFGGNPVIRIRVHL